MDGDGDGDGVGVGAVGGLWVVGGVDVGVVVVPVVAVELARGAAGAWGWRGLERPRRVEAV